MIIPKIIQGDKILHGNSKIIYKKEHGRRYLLQTTVQSLYRSIIEPHFRFRCAVSRVCSATALNKLQKLQNRAARIATNSPYDAPSHPQFGKTRVAIYKGTY